MSCSFNIGPCHYCPSFTSTRHGALHPGSTELSFVDLLPEPARLTMTCLLLVRCTLHMMGMTERSYVGAKTEAPGRWGPWVLPERGQRGVCA